MLFSRCIFVGMLFSASALHSQDLEFDASYIRIGYAQSYLQYRPGNLEYFKSLPQKLNGVHIGTSMMAETNDGVYVTWDVDFINRSFVVRENGGVDKFRVRMNSYNLLCFGGIVRSISFGASFLDVNRISIAQKGESYPSENLSNWVEYYDKKTTTNFSSHFKAGLYIPIAEDVMAIQLQGMYQRYWFPVNFAVPFDANNYTISLTLLMGGSL